MGQHLVTGVETAKYHAFLDYLTNREPRYVDPAAEDLFADLSWETIEDPSGIVAEETRLRGPSSPRLMGIKISGDRAHAVGCTDRHRSEFTPGDSTGWGRRPMSTRSSVLT